WPRLIVPAIEAVDSIGDVSIRKERSSTMLPDALANRPVPPVMMWVSVTTKNGGGGATTCPVVVVMIWSPLAAVHTAVPDAVAAGGGVTVNSEVNVNRPRWVASPVPVS